MKRISPHLRQLSLRISNVWLHEDGQGGRFLIDTGHPLERLTLMADLWAAGLRGKGDLTAVLLTHRHSDHAGNAAFVRKFYGARVYCHADEAEVLRGNKCVQPLARQETWLHKRLLCGYEDRHPALTEIDDAFGEGDWRWGFRVRSVPGHTEGSVMIEHPATRTLYTGDSILVGYPLRRSSQRLRLADPDFSVQPEVAHRSVRRYLAQPPQTEYLCSGHGPVVTEDVVARLRKLAASVSGEA